MDTITIAITAHPTRNGESQAEGHATFTLDGHYYHTRRWVLPHDDHGWGDAELLPDSDDPLVDFVSLHSFAPPLDGDGYIEARTTQAGPQIVEGGLLLPDDTYHRITAAIAAAVADAYDRALWAAEEAYDAAWRHGPLRTAS